MVRVGLCSHSAMIKASISVIYCGVPIYSFSPFCVGVIWVLIFGKYISDYGKQTAYLSSQYSGLSGDTFIHITNEDTHKFTGVL